MNRVPASTFTNADLSTANLLAGPKPSTSLIKKDSCLPQVAFDYELDPGAAALASVEGDLDIPGRLERRPAFPDIHRPKAEGIAVVRRGRIEIFHEERDSLNSDLQTRLLTKEFSGAAAKPMPPLERHVRHHLLSETSI